MFIIDVDNFKRQQLILKHLNFYHGEIDGVWGRDTIAAMQAFERSPKFKPAYPSNGMPLDPNAKLPYGIMRDLKDRRMLTHEDLTAERIAQLTGTNVRKPREIEEAKKDAEVKPEEAKEEKPVEATTQQTSELSEEERRRRKQQAERNRQKHNR